MNTSELHTKTAEWARRNPGVPIPDPRIETDPATGDRVHVDPLMGTREPLAKAEISPLAHERVDTPISRDHWLSSPGAGTGVGLYMGGHTTPVTYGGYPIYGHETQPATETQLTLGFERTTPHKESPYPRVDVSPVMKGGYVGRGDAPRQTLVEAWQAGKIDYTTFQSSLARLNLDLAAPRGFGVNAPPKPAKRMSNMPLSSTERLAGVDVGREEPATPAFPDKSVYYPDPVEREAVYAASKAAIAEHVATRLQPQTSVTHTLDTMVGRHFNPIIDPLPHDSKAQEWMFDDPGVEDPRTYITNTRGFARVGSPGVAPIPAIDADMRSAVAPWFLQVGVAMARNRAATDGSSVASPTLDLVRMSESVGTRYGIAYRGSAEAIEKQAESLAGDMDIPTLLNRGAAVGAFAGLAIEDLFAQDGTIDQEKLGTLTSMMPIRKKIDNRRQETNEAYGEQESRLALASFITNRALATGRYAELFSESGKQQAEIFESHYGGIVRDIEARRATPVAGVFMEDTPHDASEDLRDDATNDSAETLGAGVSLGERGLSVTGESDFKNTQMRYAKETEDELGASYAALDAALGMVSQKHVPQSAVSLAMGWQNGYAYAARLDGQGDTLSEVQIPGDTTRSLSTFRAMPEWEAIRTLPLDIIGSMPMDSAVGRAMAGVSDPPKPEVIRAQHDMIRETIIARNDLLPRAERGRVPEPMTMREARGMSRTIGRWLSQQEQDIAYAATGGDVSEREGREVFERYSNAEQSTSRQSLNGEDRSLVAQYEALGGFQPDPLGIALRAASTLSAIPMSPKEATLLSGNWQAQVNLHGLAKMLAKTQAQVNFATGKDTSQRDVETLYAQGNTPYEILTQNQVVAPIFEDKVATELGGTVKVFHKDKDGKDTPTLRTTLRTAGTTPLSKEQNEKITREALRTAIEEHQDDLHPDMLRYVTTMMEQGAPSKRIYGLQDPRQLTRAMRAQVFGPQQRLGTTAHEIGRFHEQQDVIKDILTAATHAATLVKNEQTADQTITMDQMASRRLREVARQGQQWFDPAHPTASQPTVGETYGVRDPGLARVIHMTAERSRRSYDETYWQARLNDVAPQDAHRLASGSADTLRENFTTALSQRFLEHPEDMNGAQRWEEHRRLPRKKDSRDMAIEALVPADMAWMGEARDFVKKAQSYEDGSFDHEAYGKLMNQWVGASPADSRESAERIYGGGTHAAVTRYMQRIGQHGAVPDIAQFESPDQFRNFLQGKMLLSAISRIGDVRGFKSMLDGMGENLNIIHDFQTTKDVENWLRGTSNQDAILPGLGNPRGAIAERVRNTRHFVNTLGMMLDTGNVTGDRIDGETLAPLSHFAGFKDDMLEGSGTTRTLRDVLNVQQSQLDQMEQTRIAAREASTRASGAYRALTTNVEADYAAHYAGVKQQIANLDESLTLGLEGLDPADPTSTKLRTEMEQEVAAQREAIYAGSRRRVDADDLPSVGRTHRDRIQDMGLSVIDPTKKQRTAVQRIVRDQQLEKTDDYTAIHALHTYWSAQARADTLSAAAPDQAAIDALKVQMQPAQTLLGLFQDDAHKDSLATFMDASLSLMAERQRGIPIEYRPEEEGFYTKSRIRQDFMASLSEETVSGAQGKIQTLLDLHQKFLTGPQRDGQPVLSQEMVTQVADVMGARKDFMLQSFGESRGTDEGDRGEYIYGKYFTSDQTHQEKIISAVRSGMGERSVRQDDEIRSAESLFHHYRDTLAKDNPEQQAIMDADENGLLPVQAGAGSGKTTALVGRIARLVAQNKRNPRDASHLVVTAFAKSAAGEITERLDAQLDPDDAAQVQVHTLDADALRTWMGYATLPKGQFRTVDDVQHITGEMRERVTGIAAAEWAPAWEAVDEMTQDGQAYTAIHSIFTPLGGESEGGGGGKAVTDIVAGIDTRMVGNQVRGRKEAMEYLGKDTTDKNFHGRLNAHILGLTDAGYLGTRYLESVGYQREDGSWASNVRGLKNLSEDDQVAPKAQLYIGQVMAGLHTDYATRGRGDFTFIKTAAAGLLDRYKEVSDFVDRDTTVGMVDEGNDTAMADRRYAVSRFGRGLTVIGDQGQNVGVDYRHTALNFITDYANAWKGRGRTVHDTLSLTRSQRQGEASMVAVNAILGTKNTGNTAFGDRKGVFSYTNYDPSVGLSKEITGQINLLQQMMGDDPQFLEHHKIAFITPTRATGVPENITRELTARGIRSIGANKEWEKEGMGSVIVDTIHGSKGRTFDAMFGIGFGEGDMNLTKLGDMIPLPAAIRRMIANNSSGSHGDEGAGKKLRGMLQKAFMAYVAMTRSNVTIMSGTGTASALIQPAITALRHYDAAQQGVDSAKTSADFTVPEAIQKSRGKDAPMSKEMVAQIGEDREKLELATHTGREGTIEKDIHRLIPADFRLQKGAEKFQEEQARRHLKEAPDGLRLLAEANSRRTRQHMPAVALTWAQYTRALSGDQTALAETHARGGPNRSGGMYEAVITDSDYTHNGRAINRMPTGTILSFDDKQTQEPLLTQTHFDTTTLSAFGVSHFDQLQAEWSTRYGAEQFNTQGFPTGFHGMRDFAYGMQPAALFRNTFEIVAHGDTSKNLLDAGMLTPPPTVRSRPRDHAPIPAMPQRTHELVERDGVRYDDRYLISGRATPSNPWQAAIHGLNDRPEAPEFERKDALGGVFVTSDKAQYESIVSRGASGYSLEDQAWANPTFPEGLVKAASGPKGRGRIGMVASELATRLAMGHTMVTTGTERQEDGTPKKTMSDLMARVGSDLGAQRNVAIYSPDTDMATALQTSFAHLTVAKGGADRIRPDILKNQSNLTDTLGQVLEGKNGQAKLVSGERNDGIGTRIFRDNDYIVAFTGPRGGAFEASRNPDPRMQQQNPLTFEDQQAAHAGIAALLQQRVAEAAADKDASGTHRQVRVRAGGAQGIDLLAGDVAMGLGLPLDLMLPAKPSDWAEMAKLSVSDQARLRAQSEYALGNGSLWVNNRKADREDGKIVTDLREVASGRNGMLLANHGRIADEVVTYWDGRGRGGTANTLRMASALGVPITNLHQGEQRTNDDGTSLQLPPPTDAPAYDDPTMRRYLEAAANGTRITSATEPSIIALSGQSQREEAAVLAGDRRKKWEAAQVAPHAASPDRPHRDIPDAEGASFTPQPESGRSVAPRDAGYRTSADEDGLDRDYRPEYDEPLPSAPPTRPKAAALPVEVIAPPKPPNVAAPSKRPKTAALPSRDEDEGYLDTEYRAEYEEGAAPAPARGSAPPALPKEALVPPTVPQDTTLVAPLPMPPADLPKEVTQPPPADLSPPTADQAIEALPVAPTAPPPPPLSPEIIRQKQSHAMLRHAAGLVPDAARFLSGGIHLATEEEAQIEATRIFGDTANGQGLRGWNDPETNAVYVTDRYDPSGTADAARTNAGMAYTLLHEMGHIATEDVLAQPKGHTLYAQAEDALTGGTEKPLPEVYAHAGRPKALEALADLFAQGHGARDFAGNPDLWMQPQPQHRDSSINERFARAGYSFFNAVGQFARKFSEPWRAMFPGQGNQPDVAGMVGSNVEKNRPMSRSAEEMMNLIRRQTPANVHVSRSAGKGDGNAHIDFPDDDEGGYLDTEYTADYDDLAGPPTTPPVAARGTSKRSATDVPPDVGNSMPTTSASATSSVVKYGCQVATFTV